MHFTGIDDPYEAPEYPEITLDVNDSQGRRQSPEAMARIILTYLEVSHLNAQLHFPVALRPFSAQLCIDSLQKNAHFLDTFSRGGAVCLACTACEGRAA